MLVLAWTEQSSAGQQIGSCHTWREGDGTDWLEVAHQVALDLLCLNVDDRNRAIHTATCYAPAIRTKRDTQHEVSGLGSALLHTGTMCQLDTCASALREPRTHGLADGGAAYCTMFMGQ